MKRYRGGSGSTAPRPIYSRPRTRTCRHTHVPARRHRQKHRHTDPPQILLPLYPLWSCIPADPEYAFYHPTMRFFYILLFSCFLYHRLWIRSVSNSGQVFGWADGETLMRVGQEKEKKRKKKKARRLRVSVSPWVHVSVWRLVTSPCCAVFRKFA